MSAGFLALLDDVAAIMAKAAANTKIVAGTLDDIAAMTGAGAKGASAVVIDDIPVNAQALTEFEIDAKREIPIIKAIEKGSLINKAIAIPLAMVVNTFTPALLTPILAIGGVYLGYEGAEKVIHALQQKFGKSHDPHHDRSKTAKTQKEFENQLVKGAIRTDLVMSIEIIFIAMSSMKELMPQAGWVMLLSTLAIVGFIVTKGIYSLVKGLIRLDDLALHLDATAKDNKAGHYKRRTAALIIRYSPLLMKTMSIVGAAAMLFISGELVAMQLTVIADVIHHLELSILTGALHLIAYSFVGLLIGSLLIGLISMTQQLIKHLTMKNPMLGGD
ncbi:MAG TPA: DUF808 family protein [Alphaproteobacteria bacterium]|nr:DUF808 family protein [Alphaproteobacteria bacterium]